VNANCSGTNLFGAKLAKATVGFTTFANVDFSNGEGLDEVLHVGPSSIGIDTLYRSQGNIPKYFLRQAGVPESFVAYLDSLLANAIEFYSCFVSYSSQDQLFAERLHADLQNNSVRCWFAPHDLRTGDRFRDRIDESIRLHDKLLLILSDNSIRSGWVRTEVEAAFERENRHLNKTVLFSIRIDDAVMDTTAAWAADIRRTRHIADFTRWKDLDSYQQAFERLLRDLKGRPRGSLGRCEAEPCRTSVTGGRQVFFRRERIRSRQDAHQSSTLPEGQSERGGQG